MWNIAKKHDILSSKFSITAGGIGCGIYGYSNCQILFDTGGCLAAVGIVKFSACAAGRKKKDGSAITDAGSSKKKKRKQKESKGGSTVAIGSKYAPLTKWLQQCGKESVRLTFAELNEIIPIPNYAYKDRPSWANLTKPSSFCSGWINAGYIVGAISMQEQWVEFCRGEVKGHLAKPRSIIKKTDHKAIAAALQCGYDCYDDIATDPNHRYLSWEYCHAAFKQHRQQHDEATVDFLCLHLAWYLASWGMLRNSFLMQKDYKIHAAVVTLVNQPEWEMLWDISADKLAQEWYANRIMQLCEAITEAYVASGAGIPTETLLTKILLGTIGCVPAYDRYFKKALSLTGAAQQSCNARSLMALGKLYIDHRDEFEALRKHCSERVEYPAAKVIDMCFFEYGLRNDGGGEE